MYIVVFTRQHDTTKQGTLDFSSLLFSERLVLAF